MRTISLLVITMSLSVAAVAGSIQGKVSPGNSVVYVDAVPGKIFPAPSAQPVISQQNLTFKPHLLAVQQGTTVEFQNDDSVQHNVFWPSVGGNRKEAHNMGTWPKGEKRPFKFDRPGVVPLLCNVHPEMSGYVVVSPTPYFVTTDVNGNYKIENVPDGKYNVVAWHEGSKQQTKAATVASTTTVDFTLAN